MKIQCLNILKRIDKIKLKNQNMKPAEEITLKRAVRGRQTKGERERERERER